MVVEEHLSDATCNFLIVFVRGDKSVDDNRYGRQMRDTGYTARLINYQNNVFPTETIAVLGCTVGG